MVDKSGTAVTIHTTVIRPNSVTQVFVTVATLQCDPSQSPGGISVLALTIQTYEAVSFSFFATCRPLSKFPTHEPFSKSLCDLFGRRFYDGSGFFWPGLGKVKNLSSSVLQARLQTNYVMPHLSAQERRASTCNALLRTLLLGRQHLVVSRRRTPHAFLLPWLSGRLSLP